MVFVSLSQHERGSHKNSDAEDLSRLMGSFNSSLYLDFLKEISMPKGTVPGQPSYIIQLLKIDGMENFLRFVGQQDHDVPWMEPLRVLHGKTHAWLKANSFQAFVQHLHENMPTAASVVQVRGALLRVIQEYEGIMECHAAEKTGETHGIYGNLLYLK